MSLRPERLFRRIAKKRRFLRHRWKSFAAIHGSRRKRLFCFAAHADCDGDEEGLMAKAKKSGPKPEATAFERWLDSYFAIGESGSSIRTEIIAGFTTFLTMAYIIVVNPLILSKAGMPQDSVFVATCLAAAVATAVMGLYAKYPIALAPGMGLNAFFAFTIVLTYKYTWQQALWAVFLSGVLFFIVSVLRIREYIIDAIPMNLKLAISAGVGLFLAIIALENSGIVVDHPATLVTLGKLDPRHHSPPGPRSSAIFGFILIAALNYRKIPGATHARHAGIVADRSAYRSGFAKFTGVVSLPPSISPTLLCLRLVAHLRADVHRRGAYAVPDRRVRQRRYADRRHASFRPARQERQAASHAAGADFGQLRRDVRLRDRHLDHHELYREQFRCRGWRPYRSSPRWWLRSCFCLRSSSRRSPLP
jgi:hypothetical protein